MPAEHVVERAYVWDRFVRLHHWNLAALVLLNAFIFDGGGPWHRWAGYAALGLVGTRLVWGAIGSRHARFSGFFPTPARIRAYLARPGVAMRGHNPLGAAMVFAMLGFVIALGVTGWLMGTDAYWGEEWLEQLHETFSDVLLACVALHVAGVTWVSRKTRINLPRAMLTGYKKDTGHAFRAVRASGDDAGRLTASMRQGQRPADAGRNAAEARRTKAMSAPSATCAQSRGSPGPSAARHDGRYVKGRQRKSAAVFLRKNRTPQFSY